MRYGQYVPIYRSCLQLTSWPQFHFLDIFILSFSWFVSSQACSISNSSNPTMSPHADCETISDPDTRMSPCCHHFSYDNSDKAPQL
ncbi:uncharacterized protein DS421_19g654520 [Arachis hypogaea]|uniref:Uncharacterized protein n=1 Tax=Arachis hypogaea TaxID=3818 RepID=A0A6B9V8S2_ARAHY|nr:uncharacterized protein DS421_19g654520 [Arachis hypogaea]